MSVQTPDAGRTAVTPPEPATEPAPEPAPEPPPPPFILYLEAPEYGRVLRQLTLWVHNVLLPVYGREVTPLAPWCSRWWKHPEAVAQLHALWLAWGELSDTASEAGMSGPASWHRDYLGPVMQNLRDPSGVFAGCKPGAHRPKDVPVVDTTDPFAPPPEPPGAQG
ncbi:DUF4913 domain-containing protein [Streptomyces antibioticus]|uniref:DUF4913 domain-containing protein n=1 Tax=Streptomyces antibioticus TaxID=1890 RepID=UPI00368D6583